MNADEQNFNQSYLDNQTESTWKNYLNVELNGFALIVSNWSDFYSCVVGRSINPESIKNLYVECNFGTLGIKTIIPSRPLDKRTR